MSGHHSFRTLQARIAADLERRARRESERRLSEAIIELAALREARGATQQQSAEVGRHPGERLPDRAHAG
jgi:hypothetical protein